VHIFWEEVAGTARAKWLLWTGETIDAQTALQWGAVNEVVPHRRAVDRGNEIAKVLAAKPALYRTRQKQTLNINRRRRIATDPPFACASKASPPPASPIRADTPRTGSRRTGPGSRAPATDHKQAAMRQNDELAP
jgi:hypothetical protein